MLSAAPKLVLLALLLALALGRPGTAAAAPCANDLTVAGIAVTGADCIDVGNGEILIDQPKLLSAQAVLIQGKMILSQDRGNLRQEALVVPLVASVLDSAGTYRPFIAGQHEIGTFEVCDLFTAFSNFGGRTTEKASLAGEPVVTNDRLAIQNADLNCRSIPAMRTTQPALKLAAQLLKLKLSISPIHKIGDKGVVVALPNTFGLDEERGGRIFGNFTVELPLAADKAMRLGLTVEHSRSEGIRPVSVGGAYLGKVPVLPGVAIYDPAFLIDPVNERYGGRVRLSFPPKAMASGVELLVEQGAIKRIGVDVGIPPPGFPIGAPPIVAIQSFGGTFVAGSKTTSVRSGETITTPASILGRMSMTAGPILPLPTANVAALVGDLDMTIQGPLVQLVGTLTAVNKLITLGSARLLIGGSPVRFEADATMLLKIPLTNIQAMTGFVFLGATATAFTGLGTFTVAVPAQVPFIGGQTLGGFSGVISNKAAAGVITVDPPLFDPRTVGVAFKYGGGFDIIDSIAPFITVTPTRTLSASVSATRARRSVSFRVKRARRNVVIAVKGRQKPSRISLTTASGGRIRTIKLPTTEKGVVSLGVAKLRAGRYTVTARALSKVTLAEVQDAPFLDPQPGFGTRPRGPVTAGTPVPVCWNVKHAPKGAVVDLFEDTNGSQGTGRDIRSGLPPKGCHTISTDDWEPGRHWAYGVVRLGASPISARYWPIGITIIDPRRLPAPTAVQVTATADGAQLSWQRVDGATGYVVTAVPANPQDAPAHREVVLDDEQPDALVALRGAEKWNVIVQAVDGAGALGNPTAPVLTGGTTPVVLSGTPNGTPQVGQPWAFKLKTANLASLKLVQAPAGTKLDAGAGLLTWTPSAAAGKAAPQLLKVEGCSGDNRCFTQEWRLSAYGRGFAPAGPARGFEVLDSVVKAGQRVELRAQGVDEKPLVEIDGTRVRARAVDEQTVSVTLPKRLAKGAHDVSLQIGQDLKETLRGAIVVL